MILTAITAVFWIMFSAYRSFTKIVPAVVPQEMLEPITPKLDSQTIEIMRNKIYP